MPNTPSTLTSAQEPFSGNQRRHSGVTLIEVMVTVLVLSIGLIGLASLQGNALKANHSAYMRAQATILAYDMLDMMRVDRSVALQQAYDGTFTAPPSGNDLPSSELNRWITDIQNTLPASQAAIVTDSSNNIVTISVTWDDTRGEETPETFSLRTRL
ncbi:type IV pilus modification protein PilV [Thioalkalivibrio sp. ALE16]|uniref:type IV pilus modification protein PilV n=1 Tax=Thioalkalivibrio sp. ALE16 TaxID=1158172 RepID=UPI0018C9E397|nr:type IV pilus modification protein PilV [Thioalkalivibrio sp. ALE16]